MIHIEGGIRITQYRHMNGRLEYQLQLHAHEDKRREINRYPFLDINRFYFQYPSFEDFVSKLHTRIIEDGFIPFKSQPLWDTSHSDGGFWILYEHWKMPLDRDLDIFFYRRYLRELTQWIEDGMPEKVMMKID